MIRFNLPIIKQGWKFLLLAAVVVLGGAGKLSADVRIYVDDFSIAAGETKEIAMNLDTDETNLAQIRGFIQMPVGLTIVENSAKPNSSRAPGAVGNVNPRTGEFAFSMISGSFSGTSGPIFTFRVTAADDLAASSQITYSDVQCGPRRSLIGYDVAPTNVTNSDSGTVDPIDPVIPAGTLTCAFNVPSLTFLPKETAEKEVEVALTNGDDLTGFQARLVASEGLEIVGIAPTDRLTGWNESDGRIMSYGAISAGSGAVFTVKLKPQEGFAGDATLTVKNIAATTTNASASLTAEAIVLDVHVISSPVIQFSPDAPITLASGGSVELAVLLDGESQMSLYQAKLILPEGITAEVTNGDVATANPSYNPANGSIVGTGLTKRSGTLLNIKLTAGEAFVANGVVELRNVSGTTTSAYSLEIESISLEVNAVARLVEAPAAKALTYNAEEQSLVEAGTASGTASVVYSLDGENYSEAIPTGKDAGSYTVYYKVVAGDNQTSDETAQYDPVSVVIAKATLTSATLEASELVYNNQEQTVVVTEVKAGELVVPAEGYTVSGATAKDKGEYVVTVSAVEDGNFAGSITANYSIIANAENDEAYDRLKTELDNLEQAIADAKTEIESDAADVKDDYLAQLDALSDLVDAARAALETANEAVTLTSESVNENVPSAEEIAAIVAAAKQAQADKEAADQLAADKAAFEAYKAEQTAAVDALAEDGDSEASQKIIADAKDAIEALEYDESKSLEENKAAVDAIVAPVADALAAQRAADQLAADKAAFEAYKAEQTAAVEALAEDGDSEASQKIIADAKDAIEALEYDEAKSLEENKAAVDAIVAEAVEALAAQRAADAVIVLDENDTTVPETASNVKVQLKRTINADEWSTICLPFAITGEQVKTAFGDDVLLAAFTGWESEKTTAGGIAAINVFFAPVDAENGIEANTPMIIKVSSAIESVNFEGVSINAGSGQPVVQVGQTASERGCFYGTYTPMNVPEKNVFISEGKFWYSTGLSPIKGYRCYFDFYDVLDAYYDSTADVKISLFVGDDPTGIDNCEIVKSSNGQIYDLSGQMVNGKWSMTGGRLPRGIYIVNGRKQVVK